MKHDKNGLFSLLRAKNGQNKNTKSLYNRLKLFGQGSHDSNQPNRQKQKPKKNPKKKKKTIAYMLLDIRDRRTDRWTAGQTDRRTEKVNPPDIPFVINEGSD